MLLLVITWQLEEDAFGAHWLQLLSKKIQNLLIIKFLDLEVLIYLKLSQGVFLISNCNLIIESNINF